MTMATSTLHTPWYALAGADGAAVAFLEEVLNEGCGRCIGSGNCRHMRKTDATQGTEVEQGRRSSGVLAATGFSAAIVLMSALPK
jgi:hypothetical protein